MENTNLQKTNEAVYFDSTEAEIDISTLEKSVAFQRILKEITKETDVYNRYDRTHNRHNRS